MSMYPRIDDCMVLPDVVSQELGLSGVQIGSHVEKWNLDAPELRPFFKVLIRATSGIYQHPLYTGGQRAQHNDLHSPMGHARRPHEQVLAAVARR